MAKYYGMIGYAEVEDNGVGVWAERIVERPVYGDLIRNSKQNESGDSLNDDIRLKNDISIVMDPYAIQNFARIRYATFMGERWSVSTVDVERPRLILSMGGVYNGPTPITPEPPGGDSGGEEGILPAPGDGEDGVPGNSIRARSVLDLECEQQNVSKAKPVHRNRN